VHTCLIDPLFSLLYSGLKLRQIYQYGALTVRERGVELIITSPCIPSSYLASLANAQSIPGTDCISLKQAEHSFVVHLVVGLHHAKDNLTAMVWFLTSRLFKHSDSRNFEAACKGICSLGHKDIVPPEYIRQLSLERLWLGDDFQDADVAYFLYQGIYQRYRNGGTLEDLLASTLFAEETLGRLKGGDPQSPSRSRSYSSSKGNHAPGDATSPGGDRPTSSSSAALGPPNTRVSDNRNEAGGADSDFKAGAAVTFADRLACIFEWNKTTQNYLLTVFAGAGAVNAASEAQPWVKAWALDVLSIVYKLKWQKGNILGDLSDSIEASKAAMECGDPKHEHWPVILANYAGHLELRYGVTHDVSDIDEAIRLSRDSYDLAANDHDRARAAVNIAAKFQIRAKVATEDREQDISQVVNFMKIAIRLTPPDLPERWSRLRGTSIALAARATITHASQDLIDAISYARQALAAVPPQSPVREILLTDLADALERHYMAIEDPQKKDLGEINECIRWTKEVKVMYEHKDYQEDSRYQVSHWYNLVMDLGKRIYLKYEQTQDPADAGEAEKLGDLMLKNDGSPFGSGTMLKMGPPPEDAVQDKSKQPSPAVGQARCARIR
jgi:tetratricopeptide (TPR) repeat protein